MKRRRLLRTLAFACSGLALLNFAPGVAVAQNILCGSAVYQLQSYVANVNQIANYEYNQGIIMRCGPNIACQQTLLYQLNSWYQQQYNLANSWYATINNECSSSSSSSTLGGNVGNQQNPPQIQTSRIENIDVDDEDQTVRIRIPSSPMIPDP